MKLLFITIFSCYCIAGIAQIQNPVQWSFSSKKISDKTYEVRATASIEAGWHIYSGTTGKGGPIPTRLSFTKNTLTIPTGSIREEGILENVFDKNFNTTVKYYSNKVDFIQVFKLKANVKTNIAGKIEYMACDDKRCLPPKKISFNISLL